MSDFETRVQEILNSETPNHVKLAEIRKLYAPKIDPKTCKNDRLYRVVVSDYETIGWRGSKWEFRWSVQWRDGSVILEEDRTITVLGEYHPEDEHVGKVYECIEDAVADGMGKYSVMRDRNGCEWVFYNGGGFSNHLAPFTVLHWAPKEAEELDG